MFLSFGRSSEKTLVLVEGLNSILYIYIYIYICIYKGRYLGNEISYPRSCDQFTDYVYTGSLKY